MIQPSVSMAMNEDWQHSPVHIYQLRVKAVFLVGYFFRNEFCGNILMYSMFVDVKNVLKKTASYSVGPKV